MEYSWRCSLLVATTACALLLATAHRREGGFLPTDPDNQRSRGNTFYVGFMRNDDREEDRDEPNVQILVSTDEPDPVSFSVTGGGIDNMYTATYGGITKIELLADTYRVLNDRERNKGIRVQAESGKTISVHGINDEFRSTDGFSALSCDGMKIGTDTVPFTRYEYLIFSGAFAHDVSSGQMSSELLIIPCEDDTDFTIYPTQRIIFDFGEGYFQVSRGQTGSWTGDAGETYMIDHVDDLSGTIIRSDRPAVVYAGHQCAQVPTGVTACDHLVEQIPPHTTWGHTYFLNPLAARESGDIYHVGTVFDNTQVTVTCVNEGSGTTETSSRTLNRAYDQNRLEFKTHDDPNQLPCPRFIRKYCCVEATNPVLVAQYSQGYSTDDQCTSLRPGIVQEVGDPFMIVVPPVIQYLNNYTFSTIEAEAGPFPSTYVNIAVHERFFQPHMIIMDGSPVETDMTQWNPFYRSGGEICGYGISKVIVSGIHNIYHEMEVAALGVCLYGFQQKNSFGFPAGVELQPVSGAVVECTCPGDCAFPENVNTITITCTRSLDIDISSGINVRSQPTIPMEATEPMDYNLVNQTFHYDGRRFGDTVTFDIIIHDDSDAEENEAFEITVTPVKNIVILTPVIRVTILCDESDGGIFPYISVGFAAASYGVLEGNQVNLSIVRTGAADMPVTVTLSTAGKTATGGMDYEELTAVSVLFSHGVSTQTVTLTTLTDSVAEGDENLTVMITTTQCGLDITAPQANVTIMELLGVTATVTTYSDKESVMHNKPIKLKKDNSFSTSFVLSIVIPSVAMTVLAIAMANVIGIVYCKRRKQQRASVGTAETYEMEEVEYEVIQPQDPSKSKPETTAPDVMTANVAYGVTGQKI